MDLVITIHSNPKVLPHRFTVRDGYSFKRWKIIYNELEERYDQGIGIVQNPCSVFLDKENWIVPQPRRPTNLTRDSLEEMFRTMTHRNRRSRFGFRSMNSSRLLSKVAEISEN